MLARRTLQRGVAGRCCAPSRSLSTPAQVIALTDRRVLRISGSDSKKFLQGLTTNDMNKLQQSNDCLATAFLSAKGRIMSTALAYHSAVDDAVLVEIHESHAKDLKRYLTMYRLRSQVKIEDADCQVQWHAAPPVTPSAALCSAADPRLEALGHRVIVPAAQALPADAKLLHWHRLRSLLWGVGDGPEMANRIPLEVNLDLLNHIAFDKGCYVGQELTARTKYKGLVRKRMVPFVFTSTAFPAAGPFAFLAPEDAELLLAQPAAVAAPPLKPLFKLQSDKGSVGEVVASDQAAGLALVNLEALLSAQDCQFAVRQCERGGGAEGEEESVLGEVVGSAKMVRPSWFPVPPPSP